MPTNASSKRAVRIENKKKKMAALLELRELNEYDRVSKKEKSKTTKIGRDFEPPSPKKLRTIGDAPAHMEDPPPDEPAPILGPSGKPKLSGIEYQQLKKLLREQTNRVRQQPQFRLRDMGYQASLQTDIDNRVPLFLSDIQHLILYSQLGHHAPYSPVRWCALDKFNRIATTAVLIVENVSLYDFAAHESQFPFISSHFQTKLEILTPHSYSSDIVQELSMVPLTGTQMKRFINQFGTLESAVLNTDQVFDTFKKLFPIGDTATQSTKWQATNDRFPRTQLLLSGWQMVEENYPLPIKGLMHRKYAGYVLTKDRYEAVTPASPMFGLDCEMCLTSTGELELTRVSVVDEQLNTFYDTLVKPKNRITNYLTQFSGITAKLMRGVTTNLNDVQNDLRRLIPADAILVGQSLSNDMHALKMMHPYVIDTSVIFNVTGVRARKTKLKVLTKEFLDIDIQNSSAGHCSTEDSSASLKLAQLKLQKSLYFGDAVMGNVENELRLYPELGTANYATSMLRQTTRVDKTALVVGVNEIGSKYKYYIQKSNDSNAINKKITCVSEENSENVIKRMINCTTSSTKHNLIIGHIKENDSIESFKRIDRLVKDIYENITLPGLIIVVFAGHKSANGGCFIQMKNSCS